MQTRLNGGAGSLATTSLHPGTSDRVIYTDFNYLTEHLRRNRARTGLSSIRAISATAEQGKNRDAAEIYLIVRVVTRLSPSPRG